MKNIVWLTYPTLVLTAYLRVPVLQGLEGLLHTVTVHVGRLGVIAGWGVLLHLQGEHILSRSGNYTSGIS